MKKISLWAVVCLLFLSGCGGCFTFGRGMRLQERPVRNRGKNKDVYFFVENAHMY